MDYSSTKQNIWGFALNKPSFVTTGEDEREYVANTDMERD